MIQFNSQSSGNTVTERYRACEMAASCNNVDEHHGGAVVFFCGKDIFLRDLFSGGYK